MTSSTDAVPSNSQLDRLLHQRKTSIHPRLLSIEYDTYHFLIYYLDNLSPIPLFANLRAGLWYTPPQFETCPRKVSFKSADGHYGTWNSSLRRPNIHLLDTLLNSRAAVVVDVTRSGKKFPDALTKTIPIWCAVMNAVANLITCQCRPKNQSCATCNIVHCHPSVPSSEVSHIQALLPRFVASWNGSQHILNKIVPALQRASDSKLKPLRCIWTRPGDALWRGGPAPLHEMDFTPIICVSASKPRQGFVEGRQSDFAVGGVTFPKREGFDYVQGAGDDEEAWSLGVSPTDFWRNREYLLGWGGVGIEERAKTIAAAGGHLRLENHGNQIWKSGVWIGEVGEVSQAMQTFDSVIVLGKGKADGGQGRQGNVLWMPLANRKGKLEHKWAFGRALGPCLAELRKSCVQESGKVFVCCSGRSGEWAAGLVIAWLVWHCDVVHVGESDATYTLAGEKSVEQGKIGKETVLAAMLHFSAAYPQYQISRNTLKQLNRFFSSPIPSSKIIEVPEGTQDF
eukprot:GFKZ01014231.1.p1 GENE.GFKZ01014231.1~~GFKZ01014231.1.p1  ORF type:complete len:511 (+),score=47.75 GFKZ01014231.1:120-1652(+)